MAGIKSNNQKGSRHFFKLSKIGRLLISLLLATGAGALFWYLGQLGAQRKVPWWTGSVLVALSFLAAILIYSLLAKRKIRRLALLAEQAAQKQNQIQDSFGDENIERIGGVINELVGKVAARQQVFDEQLKNQVKSELSAEKARMEAFLRGIGDGISIVDREMKIIWMNDTLKESFGDRVSEYCYKVYEHKDDVCGGCPVLQAFRTGHVHQSLRRVYTKGGRLRYYESTGSPIKNENGEIVAGIELARDVTPRIKLERSVSTRSRELAKANEELKVANQQIKSSFQELKQTQAQLVQSENLVSLGTLVAGVAHEINNPINFVYGSMKLMEDNLIAITELIKELDNLPRTEVHDEHIRQVKEKLDLDFVLDDVHKIVKNVTTGAERVKEIVNNLRTFSRTDTTVKVPVNIHEGIDSTLSLLYHEYKNRIDIIREYDSLPTILGHPGRLNQVFMNLLHNAFQAIEGEGTIRIHTLTQNGTALLEFTDTGMGISEEHIKNIFDPFFTTKKVGQGTGLGLSISYSIIKDHNGQIEVKSTVGKGTKFTIRLPLEGDAVEEK